MHISNQILPRVIFSIFMGVSAASYIYFGPLFVGEPLFGMLKDDRKASISILSLVSTSALSSIVGFVVWKQFWQNRKCDVRRNINKIAFSGVAAGAISTVVSSFLYLIIFNIYACIESKFSLLTIPSIVLMFIAEIIGVLPFALPVALMYGMSAGLLYSLVHELYEFEKIT